MIPVYASLGHKNDEAGSVLFLPGGAQNVSGKIASMVMSLTALYAENRGPFNYAHLHHEGRWNADASSINDMLGAIPQRVRDRAYWLAHLRAAGLVSRRQLDILRIAKQLMTKREWRP